MVDTTTTRIRLFGDVTVRVGMLAPPGAENANLDVYVCFIGFRRRPRGHLRSRLPANGGSATLWHAAASAQDEAKQEGCALVSGKTFGARRLPGAELTLNHSRYRK